MSVTMLTKLHIQHTYVNLIEKTDKERKSELQKKKKSPQPRVQTTTFYQLKI